MEVTRVKLISEVKYDEIVALSREDGIMWQRIRETGQSEEFFSSLRNRGILRRIWYLHNGNVVQAEVPILTSVDKQAQFIVLIIGLLYMIMLINQRVFQGLGLGWAQLIIRMSCELILLILATYCLSGWPFCKSAKWALILFTSSIILSFI